MIQHFPRQHPTLDLSTVHTLWDCRTILSLKTSDKQSLPANVLLSQNTKGLIVLPMFIGSPRHIEVSGVSANMSQSHAVCPPGPIQHTTAHLNLLLLCVEISGKISD